MKANGYPDCRQQVHGGGDDQVGGADDAVPEQRCGRNRRDKGEDDGAEVGQLLGFAHLGGVHSKQRYLLL